jgi:adenosylmethionine-8-amino-7-oxononanoate aminotransferase
MYDAFYDDYATLKAFLHSHSYSGNPLACALACEVLNIFTEERILEKMVPKMAILASQKHRFEALPQVGEFRQMGLVGAIEMVRDKAAKTPYPWQERRGYAVYRKALEKGALLRPLGNVVYFMPPLTIDQADLARLVDIAYEAIVEVTAD